MNTYIYVIGTQRKKQNVSSISDHICPLSDILPQSNRNPVF